MSSISSLSSQPSRSRGLERLSFAKTPDPFYRELKRRVRAYLAAEPGRSRHAGPAMWRKTATIVALNAVFGVAIYSDRLSGVGFVAAFMAFQFMQFSTTIGIAHDATHGAYSRSPRVNRMMGAIFDLLGIDSTTWIETHIDSHHAMPNVPLHDSAITSFSLVRLHPRTKPSRLSPYQHYYMFFVYAFVTVFQVYVLEPVAFAQNVVGYERKPGWGRALAKMIAKKIFVLSYSLILPLFVLQQPTWLISLGWLLGHMMCGIAIGIIFQSTHLHEGTRFIEPDDRGRLPDSFAQHILKTTSEFSTENPIVTWIAGGLNLHVTHHLFPHVSQIHLPALSRIVRETAREFGVPYTRYSLLGAIRSHLRLLARLGSLGVNRPPRLGLLEILREPKRFTESRTDLLLEAALRHGPIVRLPKPFDRMYLVSESSAVKRVLVDNAKNWRKSEEYRPLAEWLGRGLITSEGAVWAKDRRLLQPAFHRETLAQLSRQVATCTSTWPLEGKAVVDMTREMLDLSLVIIGHRLFGYELERADVDQIRVLTSECQEYVTKEMLSFQPFSRGRSKYVANVKTLRAILGRLDRVAGEGSISRLLADGDPDAQMDHLLGFIAAGHETTAVTLAWTLMLLAENPAMQDRARNDDAYLNAAVDEAMRLYPAVPCFARRATEDDVLAGFPMKRGAKVIVAPHVTHRLPQYWPNADQFDPERFLPERRAELTKNAYYPFGMGPRTCIGAAMATMECRVILRSLLDRFSLEPAWGDNEPRARAMISLSPDPKRPVLLRLEVLSGAARDSETRARSPRQRAPLPRAAPALAGSSSGQSIGSTA
jgi:linoleoyl-CoA desaturase